MATSSSTRGLPLGRLSTGAVFVSLSVGVVAAYFVYLPMLIVAMVGAVATATVHFTMVRRRSAFLPAPRSSEMRLLHIAPFDAEPLSQDERDAAHAAWREYMRGHALPLADARHRLMV